MGLTTEEKVTELEFRLTKALERLSIVDTENSKLRYEFELLREKWLQMERIMQGLRQEWNNTK